MNLISKKIVIACGFGRRWRKTDGRSWHTDISRKTRKKCCTDPFSLSLNGWEERILSISLVSKPLFLFLRFYCSPRPCLRSLFSPSVFPPPPFLRLIMQHATFFFLEGKALLKRPFAPLDRRFPQGAHGETIQSWLQMTPRHDQGNF